MPFRVTVTGLLLRKDAQEADKRQALAAAFEKVAALLTKVKSQALVR
jgi:hypothetical protein